MQEQKIEGCFQRYLTKRPGFQLQQFRREINWKWQSLTISWILCGVTLSLFKYSRKEVAHLQGWHNDPGSFSHITLQHRPSKVVLGTVSNPPRHFWECAFNCIFYSLLLVPKIVVAFNIPLFSDSKFTFPNPNGSCSCSWMPIISDGNTML